MEQLNICFSRCSSSQPFTNLVSFLRHGSREYRPIPRDRPDGRSNVQHSSFKSLHALFLPPLALGKIASDVKENPAALGGGRDEKGRESHTSTRLAWMIIDIPESSTLILTQSRRRSYYNVIHVRMGGCTLAGIRRMQLEGSNGVDHQVIASIAAYNRLIRLISLFSAIY